MKFTLNVYINIFHTPRIIFKVGNEDIFPGNQFFIHLDGLHGTGILY